MGLFGLGKKKEPSEKDLAFVFPEDLVFAYAKQGDPWKDREVKRSVRDKYPLLDFGKSCKKCLKYGLIRESEEGRYEMTDRAKALLEKHDYILFCGEHLPYERLDFGSMCAMKNRDPGASLYDVIMAGMDKKDFVQGYVDWYLEDADDDWDAEDIADRKRDAKEDAKEDYKELMGKVKALKKEGLL